MPRSVLERLQDMAERIALIRALLHDKSLQDLAQDEVATAAFERFLEIISEASRHVPDQLKQLRPDIPWRRVADIGNWLRHVYDRVDPQLLWQVYTDDLVILDHAITELIKKESARR